MLEVIFIFFKKENKMMSRFEIPLQGLMRKISIVSLLGKQFRYFRNQCDSHLIKIQIGHSFPV